MTKRDDAEKRGSRKPRIRTDESDRAVDTYGSDAAFISSSYGLNLDLWQRDLQDRWLAIDAQGNFVHPVCVCMIPRQNGKSAAVEALIVYCVAVLGLRVHYTAHEVESARGLFNRLVGFFEDEDSHPEMAKLLAPNGVRRANGQESIKLVKPEGADYAPFVRFRTRTRGGGRGGTVDVLIIDEAQEYNDEQQDALNPMISASKSPLQIILGTPPGPSSVGTVVTRLRKRVIDGDPTAPLWDEWSIPDDVDPRDAVKDWAKHAAATNPTFNVRLKASTVESETKSMSPDGFARERLGQWTMGRKPVERVITDELWDKTTVGTAPEDGVPAIGIASDFDGKVWSIAGAVRDREDRSVYAELIDHTDEPGAVEMIVDWLTHEDRWRNYAQVAIAAGPNSDELARSLRAEGVGLKTIQVITTPEYMQSATALVTGLADGWLTHPQAENDRLTASVKVAEKKSKTNGWGWTTSDPDGDITPVEALSVAVRAARTTKRDPRRRATIL